jgi:glycosyltransferase involved in cell wall biosynthesis
LKILSFQPLSLYRNGGASRVLRRLYKGAENSVYSIGVTETPGKLPPGEIAEIVVPTLPLHRPWMRWKIRNLFIWLRQKVFKFNTMRQIQKAAQGVDYDTIHMIHHGPYAMALCKDELLSGKQLWVSFHDHYLTTNTNFTDTQYLWNKAHRRLVISTELGQEYQRLFNYQNYEIITDGVLPGEFSSPRKINKEKPVIIYFSGLLHLGYYSLFRVLADALDIISMQGIEFKLVMRGTQQLDFLKNRNYKVEYRINFISDEAIKQEMDIATILYLPIKFNNPEFYLYSLSTKMVGYLASPGSILYHGPADSAAYKMLDEANAAICCTTLTVDDMVIAINELINNKSEVSEHAKKLAYEKFNFDTIREIFWQTKIN